MKIINHNKNNYTYDLAGSVVRGTIEMLPSEWQEVKAYLKYQTKDIPEINNLTMKRTERVSKYLGNDYYSLGVTPTEMIFKKFKLPRYKHQNYQIKVLNK